MGVGGGIIADSDPNKEYRECLPKTTFVTRLSNDFQLIETMLWGKKSCFLALHLDRLASSASYFRFDFDRSLIILRLADLSASFTPTERYRVRLLLDSRGNVKVQSAELDDERSFDCVMVSPECTSSANIFLRHKTTRRQLYECQYAEARTKGFDEVIFTNERGEITEGTTSNLFVEQAGKLFTPLLECGVLPGVFRRQLLDTSATAQEKVLTIEDLRNADSIFLCNSVRRLHKIESLDLGRSPALQSLVSA